MGNFSIKAELDKIKEAVGKIQAVITQTPYIVDKLRAYEIQLEQELLTYLGIDNNGGMNNTHITMDAVNANNDLINSYKESIRGEMEKWIEQVNRIFGRNIKIEDAVSPDVQSVHEEINNGGKKDDVQPQPMDK